MSVGAQTRMKSKTQFFSIREARLQRKYYYNVLAVGFRILSDTSRDLGSRNASNMRRTSSGKVHGHSNFLAPRKHIGQDFWPRVALSFDFSDEWHLIGLRQVRYSHDA